MGGTMQFQCAAQTHIGLRRKLNEDSLLDRSDIGLWAVADGMGGHESGEVASAAVVTGLQELPVQPSSDDMARSIIKALETVNDDLFMFARSDMQPRTIGSSDTAVIHRQRIKRRANGCGQCSIPQPHEDPGAFLVAAQQPGIGEDADMARHPRLALAQHGGEFAHRQLHGAHQQ